ncbi:MAG TPA: DUF6516 family protein [Terracidiphilus sp.]
MSPRKPPIRTMTLEEHHLKGKRKGALLREQVWFEDGQAVAYSLAYINMKLCPADNGRVLGYDNSHEYHHRHFMGEVEAVEFTTYAALAERFIKEVHELWRIEDEQE